ncbi:alpha/beta fold hydrolase [Wenjunlia tyrosinilytica]|uniref:Lipase n=1 Tax=Wenjunlia tyrosinilytica TaxID=1544741 RepID=A0A917ZIU0_9ACTN|nr:alpha/beta hydrolase [Wenjunlia tyrosinilytica]GGO83573.1 lipase [Wenjunlia tyrosinilytica]
MPDGEAARTAEALVEAAKAATSDAGRWGRAGKNAGVLGLAVGVVAAGAAAGVAVERLTVGRTIRRNAQLALDAADPFGALRGEPGTAVAEDGTELYYEIDDVEPADPKVPQQRRGWRVRRRSKGSAARPPLTVVFCHGYTLNQDAFHFQRELLRGRVRAVYWDQRSHGRSERGKAQLEGVPATIDQLGRDLKAVVDAAAPQGPLVLVGHSMGGMTVMAFADQFPETVRERVAGVAFIGTTAGSWGTVTFGLPSVGAKALHKVAPGVLRVLGRQVDLVERGRRTVADVLAGLIKRYSFGGPDVDPAVARFAERMIEATPIDVVAELYPAITAHEKTEALDHIRGVPALVLAGTKDLLTPAEHSSAIAAKLPLADLVVLPDTGHLVMLERPEVVNAHLCGLLARAADAVGACLPDTVRALGEAAARTEPAVGL